MSFDTVREALSHNPACGIRENNFLAEESVIPNDSYYTSQWHHPKIKAPYGWDINTGSDAVSIAILDSGVDPAHSDLGSKLLPGYNFVLENTDTHDTRGHGLLLQDPLQQFRIIILALQELGVGKSDHAPCRYKLRRLSFVL